MRSGRLDPGTQLVSVSPSQHGSKLENEPTYRVRLSGKIVRTRGDVLSSLLSCVCDRMLTRAATRSAE
jgi:hypothetical protein